MNVRFHFFHNSPPKPACHPHHCLVFAGQWAGGQWPALPWWAHLSTTTPAAQLRAPPRKFGQQLLIQGLVTSMAHPWPPLDPWPAPWLPKRRPTTRWAGAGRGATAHAHHRSPPPPSPHWLSCGKAAQELPVAAQRGHCSPHPGGHN